jgi:long-chain fatty acid transport protein
MERLSTFLRAAASPTAIRVGGALGRSRSHLALALSLLLAAEAAGQDRQFDPQAPPPVSVPDAIAQDELDFTGRSALVLGAGARAFGMGGAFLARADDATAASWNPAGLSYLRRPELSLVGVYSSLNTTGGLADRDELRGTNPDFVAFTYPLRLWGTAGSAQVSFQRAIPFGFERTIDRGDLQLLIDANGGFDVMAFGSGLKITPTLRVGATVNRWMNGYRQTRVRTVRRRLRQEDDFHILGAWNFNLGLIWSPIEELNVGLVGKSPFTADIRLTRTRVDIFSQEQGLPDQTVASNASSDDVKLDFPGAIGFGLSWRPQSVLTLSADYTRTFWSDTRIHNYFVLLPVLAPDQEPRPPFVADTLVFPNVRAEEQADSVQLRVGVEYVFIKSKLKIPVRLGYFNDRQYTLDALGNAPHFNGITVGAGVSLGPVLLDFAFLYESGDYVEATTNTTTSVRSRRFFASAIYRWGGAR